MKPSEFPPKFQLALRRTIFFTICLGLWLVVGTVCISALTHSKEHKKADSTALIRLDAKRSELLNVLWAETMAKSESDWAELANQKLEMYEKALLSSLGYKSLDDDRGTSDALKKAFAIVTTMGPLDMDDFTFVGKLFVVFFALIGIPLSLTVLYQGGRMITALWEDSSILVPTSLFIFISAVIYDVVEGGDDDVPFFDAVFSIFLQFSTIGEEDNEFHGILPYCVCMIGLAFISATFAYIQHLVESSLHGWEYSYTKCFSNVERWFSEKDDEKEQNSSSFNSNHNVITEEDEEDYE